MTISAQCIKTIDAYHIKFIVNIDGKIQTFAHMGYIHKELSGEMLTLRNVGWAIEHIGRMMVRQAENQKLSPDNEA